MGAFDLLQHLRTAGLALTVDGDNLIVTPRERLTDAMRSAIRAHKPGLLDALKANEIRPAAPLDDPGPKDPQQPRLMGLGLDSAKAAQLAAWMASRTAEGDDRRSCFECRHFKAGARRCGNHKAADMPQILGDDLATLPQRCAGFGRLERTS
ncbi:hypothetical protein PFX98_21355 [Paucibacter sediminis]|uniref:TubC N-terminal docking domain-containing protein n=1 Tax=Paucibacter sediminis TaxID=3019553 RepID=A0AA95NEJ9_9BURK|nr:hypothetical protein [Paucibacter sp. S2-9]WIT11417.1 hypothetical protein PFX98_21355 [Paucibacter sp. S2-9]